MDAFKVGLMSLGAIASVVFMSFQITMNQSGFGRYITYKTVVRDASGIFPKTSIKVAGINAGRIKDIELIGNNALITFEVLERVVITEDSQLRIRTVGFLGDRYLEIVVGTSGQRLEEGGTITSIEGDGVEQLMTSAADILKDIKVMTTTIRDTLAPETGTSPLEDIVHNMNAMTRDAQEVMAQLKSLIGENNERISNMIDNFTVISDQIRNETDPENMDSALANLKELMANANQMSKDMQELVADIKSGKGTVGKFLVEEEIADEVRQTLASVQRIVGRADAIRTELEMFSGVNTDYGGETAAAFRIFPSPERFYHLGITTSEFGPESETITRTSVDGGKEREKIEREQRKDDWRFDIQIGRRIQNWTVRGGLIESSGGFGVDYDLTRWNQRFSAELYDYRRDDGANFRLRTDVQIWNVIYGRLAGEDLFNNSRSLTISAGLRFTDEDLKGLVGFFL